MKYRIIIILLFLIMITVAHADHNSYLYDQANQQYQQENYQEATKQYEEIIANGFESWEVYYNLGNSYYKLGEIGKAILNYERAKRLASDNEDVKANLELANLKITDKIVEPPSFFLFTIVDGVKRVFGLNTLTWIVVILYLVLMLIIILRILLRNGKFSIFTRIVMPVALVLFLVSAAVLGLKIYDHTHIHYGIVLAEEVIIRSSPEMSSTELFTLHEGVKVQLQKENSGWFQIRLKDGKVGWMKQDAVEII
ncbi:tetratricopeptide repeat protein [candidate division KSB1 bacterium]|nr:tetratricopeptide repeat protein [candidate division KSB1 bacterium]